MFGQPNDKDRLIVMLSTQVSDLLALVESQAKDHSQQLRDLTDKLVACTNPPAFRALNPTAEPRERLAAPPRTNLPGYRPDFRPPPPTSPPEPRKVFRAPATPVVTILDVPDPAKAN